MSKIIASAAIRGAYKIVGRAEEKWKQAMDKGRDKLVLLCDLRLRAPLSVMLSRTVPLLPVVAYDEIVLGTEVEPIETISLQQDPESSPKERELVGVSQ